LPEPLSADPLLLSAGRRERRRHGAVLVAANYGDGVDEGGVGCSHDEPRE